MEGRFRSKGYNTKIASGMNNAALYEAAKTGQVDIYVDYTSSIYYQLPDPQPIDRWMDLTGSITATMNGA